jgi:hypothetical protein
MTTTITLNDNTIGYPIDDDGWRAITRATSFAGTLIAVTPAGALVNFRRKNRQGDHGPREIADGENPYGAVYLLTDNGGEINVSGVGFNARVPSVPVNHPRDRRAGVNCGPETAAYRLWAAIRGDKIDYTWDVDEDLA